MKKLFLLLFPCCFSFIMQAQVLSIADAKILPDGSVVTVRGIVTNGDELGPIRYLQDGTGGMAAYSSLLSSVQRGDSIEVTGTLDLYNNLMEINPVAAFNVISSGNPLPDPKVVVMADGFVEAYEGQLVRFNNSHFISSGTFSTASTNYDATDGSLVSAEVRINSTTNIAGTPIPVGNVDLIGIMSQFQSTYQLLPRDLNDLVLAGNQPVITTSLFQHDITSTSFDIAFSTLNPGSTILYYGTTQALGSIVNEASLVTEHDLTIPGLNHTSLYYVKAASVSSTGDTSFSPIIPVMTQSLSSGGIKCYFTRPVDVTVAQGVNAVSLPQVMDDTLIAYMNRAKYTMDIAVYNMDNANGIVDAINAAFNRGVVVRIIGDGDNMDIGSWNQLIIGAGNMKLSPVSADYGISHNKFVVIDAGSPDPNEAIVWTGSMNFTDQQVNNDANNVIIFQDQSLAKAYTMEFEEMFSGIFGPFKTNHTPKEFNIGGSRVELYFSPSDDTESEIKRIAESADYDLEFAVFAYTRFNISYSIDERTDQGVWGGGIVDDTSNGGFAFEVLYDNMSNSLFVASNSYLVHHKYLLVDANAPGLDPAVLTGSHNWSTSAQFDNDENTVVVHNASIANQYYQEWVARYKEEGGTELPGYMIGIPEVSNAAPLRLYPNPASSLVYFEFEKNAEALLVIYDVTGKLMLEKILLINQPVSLNDLPGGMYLVRVKQGDFIQSAKLMVER